MRCNDCGRVRGGGVDSLRERGCQRWLRQGNKWVGWWGQAREERVLLGQQADLACDGRLGKGEERGRGCGGVEGGLERVGYTSAVVR